MYYTSINIGFQLTFASFNDSIPDFCRKNDRLTIKLKNGKKALAKVISCNGEFADVVVNGKTVLINSKCEVV